MRWTPQRPVPVGNHFSTASTHGTDILPLRKQLKNAAKASRAGSASTSTRQHADTERLARWELTVGVEIHAQLNTPYKLFSSASTDSSNKPNSSVALFDLAVPGSLPRFQAPVLIPAIRAAIALKCNLESVSRFDRKHYFYHDQPAGYQITQYYEPLARDGQVTLQPSDGLPDQDGPELVVGIKQIQLEQDTARTQDQDKQTRLIDFNRCGYALIEIISMPHIHSPEAASAYMRKVQAILRSIDAVTTGMELGGLRADVNVSVRHVDDNNAAHSYAGVQGLGQRTEIKNLSSFKAVEDAVRAERDRQITILEAGGTIEGETRGWSLSNPGTTRRLRGKEGEVDYRYMPDPDIPPLYLDPDLLTYLQQNMPPLQEDLLQMLEEHYYLTPVDAKSLLSLDDGQRMIYFQEVVGVLDSMQKADEVAIKAAGNWTLHDLGSLLSTHDVTWHSELVPAKSLAEIIASYLDKRVTGPSAKRLLKLVFDGDTAPVADLIEREGLSFEPLTTEEYTALALSVIASHPDEVRYIQEKGKHGKIKFLMGKMMQSGDRNRMDPSTAEAILKAKLLNL